MGIPPFEPTPLRLMYEQVADHLAARIEAGEMAPGTKLPPERDLAAEYHVAVVKAPPKPRCHYCGIDLPPGLKSGAKYCSRRTSATA